MHQASFHRDGFGNGFNVAVAQSRQQVTRRNSALSATLGQPLLDQEIGALLQGLAYSATETLSTMPGFPPSRE